MCVAASHETKRACVEIQASCYTATRKSHLENTMNNSRVQRQATREGTCVESQKACNTATPKSVLAIRMASLASFDTRG
jgi:hypothetical protein